MNYDRNKIGTSYPVVSGGGGAGGPQLSDTASDRLVESSDQEKPQVNSAPQSVEKRASLLESQLKRILQKKCREHAPDGLRSRVLSVLKTCVLDDSTVVRVEHTEIQRTPTGDVVSQTTVTTNTLYPHGQRNSDIVRYEKSHRAVSRIYSPSKRKKGGGRA